MCNIDVLSVRHTGIIIVAVVISLKPIQAQLRVLPFSQAQTRSL